MNGSLIPWLPDMSGNIRIVGPRLLYLSTKSKNVHAVPYYYIPEQDIASGPAKIKKEKEDKAGFWLGTIHGGGGTAEAQGYEKGPLQGFVKVKVSDIGQLQLFEAMCLVSC